MRSAYLQDLVAAHLAERGLPGTVQIRPTKPLAARLESGERAMFAIDYDGAGTAHVLVDEYQIACGTVGAPVAVALADLVARDLQSRRAAA